jgi:Rps23 Pro-64 3,4-dihydroxylase Tpa1-like proline 4-hydroxylase
MKRVAEQIFYTGEVMNETFPVIAESFLPIEKVQALVGKSIAILEDILSDPNLSAQERAAVALQILEATRTSNLVDLTQLNTVQSTSVQSKISTPIQSKKQEPSPLQNNSPQIFYVQDQQKTLPAKYLQIDSFLSSEENKNLLEVALQNFDNFIDSTTSTQELDYRKSAVLYATFYIEYYELIRKRILNILPSILQSLNHPYFLVDHVEMQMTTHNDGCYYKMHNDSGSPDTHTRELTYVYYFCKEPPQFSGGELRLYDTDLQDSSLELTSEFQSIAPSNNSIVFFDSRLKHEVMPVSCPSKKFEDSRFTINGWIRRVKLSD